MGYSWGSSGVPEGNERRPVWGADRPPARQQDREVDNSAQQRGVIALPKLVILETKQSFRVLEAGRLKEREKKRKKSKKRGCL